MKIRKILKIIFASALIILLVFVFMRIRMMSDESVLNTVSPTDFAVSAYNDAGESAFMTHKMPEEISSDGYFSAYALCYIEKERELQLTARYNDSLTEKYLSGVSDESFTWELRDENGNTLSVAKVYDKGEKYNYNYRRLIFSDVNITEKDALYLQLVCPDADYPDEGAKNLLIHSPQNTLSEYSLSDEEIKLLTGGETDD